MLIKDFLTESASAILYHYTNATSALDVLETGKFKLSTVVASPSEETYAPKGYPYFLSLARTKLGEYSKYAGVGSTMFVLDGAWFNNNYIVRPIDYWSGFPNSGRHREAEDRVFSRTNEIPDLAIKEIHVFLDKFDERFSPRVRSLLILAKKQGIASYLYSDKKAFRILDKRRTLSISEAKDILGGSLPLNTQTKDEMMKYQEYYRSHREKEGKKGLKNFYDRSSGISGIAELLQKNEESHLTARAKKELNNLLNYVARDFEWGREKEAVNTFSTDIFNAKSPTRTDYKYAVLITDFMRKNKLSMTDFIKFLIEKWKKIKGW